MFFHILTTFLFSIVLVLQAQNPVLVFDKEKQSIAVSEGKTKFSFKLKLPKNFKVEQAPRVYSDKAIKIIIVEAADFDVASSFVFAFDAKGKKLWKKDLGTFNPSKPLIDGENVYLAGMGSVFKLNKTSGKEVWSHTKLYENNTLQFEGSSEIKKAGEYIEFDIHVLVKDKTGELQKVKQ